MNELLVFGLEFQMDHCDIPAYGRHPASTDN